MKKILEGLDKTLKGLKMKPEYQSQVISSGNKPIVRKVGSHIGSMYKGNVLVNPLNTFDSSTGLPRRGHAEYLRSKHYKNETHNPVHGTVRRTGVHGTEVMRNKMLRKSATDKVKDKLNLKGYEKKMLKDHMMYRRLDKENTEMIKKANRKKPIQATFRTIGKQRILEGGSPKQFKATSGMGLGMLKKRVINWWKKGKTY